MFKTTLAEHEFVCILAAYQRAQAADRAAHNDALIIIDRWNSALASGRATLWSPTIRCAILAGMPWLDVHRPGCGTTRAIDIRTTDRHPFTSVGSLVLGLRCSWCRGFAPMPKIVGLHPLLPAANVRASGY